jgi:hypothetical protein
MSGKGYIISRLVKPPDIFGLREILSFLTGHMLDSKQLAANIAHEAILRLTLSSEIDNARASNKFVTPESGPRCLAWMQ